MPVLLLLAQLPGIIQWIIIIGGIAGVVYYKKLQKNDEEEYKRKAQEAEHQIQQYNNQLASLKSSRLKAESVLPRDILSINAINYIKRELLQGTPWVRAVQNYQIQSITNANNVIEYGRYPKDADGTVRPIEWIELDRKADRILLMTKDCIDSFPNNYFTSKSWEESRIRHWLNHNFINKAFTSKEQNNILTVKLENKCSPQLHMPDGNLTNDNIFLLSYEEALNYFSSMKLNTPIRNIGDKYYDCTLDKHQSPCLTPYALERLYFYDDDIKKGFYTRDKRVDNTFTKNVEYPLRTYIKAFGDYGTYVKYTNGFMCVEELHDDFGDRSRIHINTKAYKPTIRPAMWLKLYN